MDLTSKCHENITIMVGGIYADASQHESELYVDHKNVNFVCPMSA